MDLVKKVRKELNQQVAILLDTKGPEIRTGNFEDPEVLLEEGQEFTITMNDVMGNKNMCTVSYKGLINDVVSGDTISFMSFSVSAGKFILTPGTFTRLWFLTIPEFSTIQIISSPFIS